MNNDDEFEAEAARIDEKFSAKVHGHCPSPEHARQYWKELTEARSSYEQRAINVSTRQAVDSHFKPKGCYVRDMGRGLFWLRPPVQKGLDFQHLVALDAKLPAGRRLRTIRAHQGGFMLVIG